MKNIPLALFIALILYSCGAETQADPPSNEETSEETISREEAEAIVYKKYTDSLFVILDEIVEKENDYNPIKFESRVKKLIGSTVRIHDFVVTDISVASTNMEANIYWQYHLFADGYVPQTVRIRAYFKDESQLSELEINQTTIVQGGVDYGATGMAGYSVYLEDCQIINPQ